MTSPWTPEKKFGRGLVGPVFSPQLALTAAGRPEGLRYVTPSK
jgi:hypothetical protein